MDRPSGRSFTVGPWTVEPQLNEIARDGEARRLEPRVMGVLVALASRPGEVVSRDELLRTAWADVVVTDNAVARAIAALRRALGDDWRRPAYIQTVSKSGYRMIAGVRAVDHARPGPGARSVPSGTRPASAGRRRMVVTAAVLGAAAALLLVAWRSDLVSPAGVRPHSPLSIPVTAMPGREMFPAISPDGTRVAFVRPSQSDGDLHAQTGWDIFVKTIGSEDADPLTRGPELDGGPAWSPDGTRIAWYRTTGDDCSLYVAIATGGTAERISRCGYRIMGRLSWSPDGAWLASSESTAPDRPRRVILTEIATGQRRHLTTPPSGARGDQYPVFSPDGRRVAFTRAFPDGRGDLYVVSAHGGPPRRLSSENRIVMGLDWAAAGDRLVYAASYGGIPALWSLAAGGGEPTPVRLSDHLVYWPSLSRTGDRLVYCRYDDDTDLYAIDLERLARTGAAEPVLVARSTRQELQPQTSPDGTRVAFVSNRSGSFEIYTSRLDGSDVRQRTAFGGAIVGMPAWSPDGRQIVFHAHSDDGVDLHMVEADGRRTRRLTDGRANALNASWSRSGDWIYFASDRSGDWQIWRMRSSGDAVQQITDDGGFRGMEDPTGEHLLFFKHDEGGIWQRPLTGRPDRRPTARRLVDEMTLSAYGHWTVAPTGIWFVRRGPDAGLAFYDFETGTSVTRYRPDKSIPYPPNTVAVTPDGQTLLFVQVERSESDIVMLERAAWAG